MTSSGFSYYVLDTETTGLRADWHEIVQISIIRCSDRHQLTKIIKADNPSRADPQALHITNKTFKDLLNGDNRIDVVNRCDEFFNEDPIPNNRKCLIAHNASFDKRFCHAMWESVGKTFLIPYWLDTIKLAREWSKKIGVKPEGFSLESVLKFANVQSFAGNHDAHIDSRNTYLLWKKVMDFGLNYIPAIKHWPHVAKNSDSQD